MYRAFWERHNLTPGKKVFADRGRSGYSGEYRNRGQLGKLIDAAKAGRFERGRSSQSGRGTGLVGYYPAVVTEAEFDPARAGQVRRTSLDKTRNKKGRRIVRRQGKYTNVFKGMLTHARDGERVMPHNKGIDPSAVRPGKPSGPSTADVLRASAEARRPGVARFARGPMGLLRYNSGSIA